MRLQLPTRLALLPLLLLGGCAEEFTPGSVVEDQRILALLAEPPELVIGQSVTVTAVTAAPGGAPPATQSWSFCPFTTGASTGYACALPRERFPLCEREGLGTGGSLTLDPTALVTECLDSLGGSLPSDPGGPVPERVEVVVRYTATDGAGLTRQAVQRIPVWTTTPSAALNTSPVFADPAIRLGGAAAATCGDPAQPGTAACPAVATLARGLPLTVTAEVTPASFQTYLAGERTAVEALAVSFFTTAGRFTEERGAPAPGAPTTSTDLEHDQVPAGTAWALVWAVVRDLRGGQAVAGPYLVAVAP